MHAKLKGNVGQFAVSLCLSKLGFSVFSEEGDISKIDLIAEKNGKVIRIQCKAATPKKDVLVLYLKKSGPNYQDMPKITSPKESSETIRATLPMVTMI